MLDNVISGSTIPILKAGSLDYLQSGNNYPSYEAHIRIIPDGNPSAEITHKLEGDSFVSQLLDEGKAQFGCELVFKGSFRREFHLQNYSSQENSKQRIQWNAKNVCQKVFFRPVIVTTENIEEFLLTENCQVSELWLDTKISLPKHAIIADAEVMRPNVLAKSLLKIRLEESFQDFEMDVLKKDRIGRTHFIVCVGKALHELVRDNSAENYDLKRAVLINALTGVFSVLLREFQRDEDNERKAIEACDVLSTLRSKLKELGIKSWDEDPDEFSPIKAATKFETLTWKSRLIMESEDD